MFSRSEIAFLWLLLFIVMGISAYGFYAYFYQAAPASPTVIISPTASATPAASASPAAIASPTASASPTAPVATTVPGTGIALQLEENESLQATERDLLSSIIPARWRSNDNGLYTLVVRPQVRDLEACEESQRQSIDIHLKILEVGTNRLVAEQDFAGEEALSCELLADFSGTVRGRFAAVGLMEAWLRESLASDSRLPALSEADTVRDGLIIISSNADLTAHFQRSLPEGWEAEDYPRYVIYLQDSPISLEVCAANNRRRERIRLNFHVSIIDLQSNEEIAAEFFEGSVPRVCPSTIGATQGGLPIKGDYRGSTSILHWFEVTMLGSEGRSATITRTPVPSATPLPTLSPTPSRIPVTGDLAGVALKIEAPEAFVQEAEIYLVELPAAWQSEPEQALYEVVIEVQLEERDSCLASNRERIERFRLTVLVTIYDRASGESINAQSFRGTEPACESRQPARINYGELPAAAELHLWILDTLNQAPELEEQEIVLTGVRMAQLSGELRQYNDAIPQVWLAEDATFARYQVNLSFDPQELERCEYGSSTSFGTTVLIRQRHYLDAEILDLETQEVILTTSISGARPAECPDSVQARGTGNEEREIFGTYPPESELVTWLTTQFTDLPAARP